MTNTNSCLKFYHCMSRLLYRCFVHGRCSHLLLSNIWFIKCVIIHPRWMSWRIPRLPGSHEWMRYHLKPLQVVCCTLFGYNTYLTQWCKVFRKLNSFIINFFYIQIQSSRVWWNGLQVLKLSHNPLWSVNDDRWTPMHVSEK